MPHDDTLLDTDPPAFYVMQWNTMGVPVTQEHPTLNAVLITPNVDLTIYGRKVQSSYEEDRPLIEDAEKRGYIFGEWFSEACPEGELGSNHISTLREITREQFDQARTLGWPHLGAVLTE